MVHKNLQGSHHKDVTREFRSSLVTRRFLIRVCKKWYRLTLPYLYEWILAVRLKNLDGIVQAIERSFSNDSGAQVGWFTRRLDINFRKTGLETEEECEQEASHLIRLLDALPNLRVMTVVFCYTKIWFTWPIYNKYCPKLECLSWMDGKVRASPDVWVDFVQLHPNLVAIYPSAITTPSFKIKAQDQSTHSLKVLTTSFTSALPISATFTSLGRLNLNLCNADFDWDHFFEHQILTPLPSLITLQLNFTVESRTDDLTHPFDDLQRFFPFLPNLRRIDLGFPVWPEAWSGATFPSTVSVLGFRVCSGRPKRQVVKRLLRSLKLMGPNPKVQILDERTMVGMCTHGKYIAQNMKVGEVLDTWLDLSGSEYKLWTS